MPLEHAFITHVGMLRTENQDSYADLSYKSVFAIADGMGGHEGGLEASQLACKAFSWQCDHYRDNTEEYIKLAHQLIVEANYKKNGDYYCTGRQMGTTGVVLLIDEQRNSFNVSWCGDSRLYHWSDKKKTLDQITIDHSLIQKKILHGEISQEDALHEKRNILEHAIGIGDYDSIHVDTKKNKFEIGDIFMLCTDGICGEISYGEIFDIFLTASLENHSAQLIAEKLIEAAMNAGGSDNATVGVIKVNEDIF